jgi:hypothetical protein
MGAGASAGLAAAVSNTPESDLKAMMSALTPDDRKRLSASLADVGDAPQNLLYGFDKALVEEAIKLDASDTNRSNILFSRLSMKVASQLLSSSPKLDALEKTYPGLAKAWKADAKTTPFCCVEGLKYAIDALKFSLIKEAGHVVICVPFYMEFERGTPATKENPNGEDSPIQKIEEALYLLSFTKKISIDLVFINDSIAEKQDNKDGGSVKLFKESLLAYVKEKEVKIDIVKAADAADNAFDSFTALDGQLCVKFTSVGAEAAKGSACESSEEKTKRLENRGSDGKLRERKGGAVLSGLEMELTEKFKDKPKRVIRCLVDGDSAHPVGSFIGAAAYSVLELGNTAYLGNLKDASTCVSVVGEEAGGGSDATQARVQNRKLFFSGFIVPFLFPELTLKYKYTGTTQLPVKAIRGDISFAEAKLPTVQPNVDLGILALVVSFLNANGGTIDSGPVTIRDNIASSTMTTSDLGAEWTKTYGPIFTSAVGLCRTLKPADFKELPEWLTSWIEGMQLSHYSTLFGDTISDDVNAIFAKMKTYREASDRSAVLGELKDLFAKAFPA